MKLPYLKDKNGNWKTMDLPTDFLEDVSVTCSFSSTFMEPFAVFISNETGKKILSIPLELLSDFYSDDSLPQKERTSAGYVIREIEGSDTLPDIDA